MILPGYFVMAANFKNGTVKKLAKYVLLDALRAHEDF